MSETIKVRQDAATGKYSAELYLESTEVTPTVATLPVFSTPEDAVAHIRQMFPNIAPQGDDPKPG